MNEQAPGSAAIDLRIGIIGTDSSHSVAFAGLLNNDSHSHHVRGGKITHAFRFSSADFELSRSREEAFSSRLQHEYHLSLCSLEELRSCCDAIMLLSADGRQRLQQFEQIIQWRKPLFIDKPLALHAETARRMLQLSRQYDVPLMSSSALRYSIQLTDALKHIDRAAIDKVIVNCPLIIEPTQRRYFWYGIHGVEMLYAILGKGCQQVSVKMSAEAETLVGIWENGAVGEVQCCYDQAQPFTVEIYCRTTVVNIKIADGHIPFYASLLERMIAFFQSGISDIDPEETLEIISFMEVAEQYKTSIST